MAGTEFFVVPLEHLSTIEAIHYPEGAVVRRLYTSNEGTVLFRLDVENTAPIPDFQQDRIDLGIAFNSVTQLSTHLIWHLQARFDHLGETDNTKHVQSHPELIELWDRFLPVCVKEGIHRRACVQALAVRAAWDCQVAWGKVHRVQRLIGAV